MSKQTPHTAHTLHSNAHAHSRTKHAKHKKVVFGAEMGCHPREACKAYDDLDADRVRFIGGADYLGGVAAAGLRPEWFKPI